MEYSYNLILSFLVSVMRAPFPIPSMRTPFPSQTGKLPTKKGSLLSQDMPISMRDDSDDSDGNPKDGHPNDGKNPIRSIVIDNFINIPAETANVLRTELQTQDNKLRDELIYNPLRSSKMGEVINFNQLQLQMRKGDKDRPKWIILGDKKLDNSGPVKLNPRMGHWLGNFKRNHRKEKEDDPFDRRDSSVDSYSESGDGANRMKSLAVSNRDLLYYSLQTGARRKSISTKLINVNDLTKPDFKPSIKPPKNRFLGSLQLPTIGEKVSLNVPGLTPEKFEASLPKNPEISLAEIYKSENIIKSPYFKRFTDLIAGDQALQFQSNTQFKGDDNGLIKFQLEYNHDSHRRYYDSMLDIQKERYVKLMGNRSSINQKVKVMADSTKITEHLYKKLSAEDENLKKKYNAV